MFLEVKGISKSYNGKRVLNNASFSLDRGKILCILGPSGCGKTTILNSIGGFIKVDEGDIILDGENITSLNPEQRAVSTVFQSYGLFGHKTVIENVEYGLKFKKIPKSERRKKALDVLVAVGLNGYEKRHIGELSGGQQQRVALARSLVVNPRLILLDEPFSNLDENLKESMRQEIKRLVKHFNMTTILVTHDQEDAFTIADKVILMSEGNIVQDAHPTELYNKPNSIFSLDFIGRSNKLSSGEFVRPEKIRVVGKGGIQARITKVIFKGAIIEYELTLATGEILTLVELNSGKYRNLEDIVNNTLPGLIRSYI